jgi:RES domain-containing protein
VSSPRLAAWRIVKTRYARAAFDGEGARQTGGRWTSIGRRAIYTAGSLALATLEIVVHLDSTETLPAYSVFKLSIPEQLITNIEIGSLPGRWRDYPSPAVLRALGDAWLDAGESAVLRVPSAVIGVEFNYLLNPAHPDFARVRIGPRLPYGIDRRLV